MGRGDASPGRLQLEHQNGRPEVVLALVSPDVQQGSEIGMQSSVTLFSGAQ